MSDKIEITKRSRGRPRLSDEEKLRRQILKSKIKEDIAKYREEAQKTFVEEYFKLDNELRMEKIKEKARMIRMGTI